MGLPPYRLEKDGLTLWVRVTPRASRDEIRGTADLEGHPALLVRLRAPPVDDAANTALIALLARQLGVGRSAVRLVAGDKSRLKTVLIEGPAEQMAARLAAILA